MWYRENFVNDVALFYFPHAHEFLGVHKFDERKTKEKTQIR